jgi:hypothetical protein
MEITDTYTVCADCAIAHANADFTGMDAETEKRVKDGMDQTGHLIIDSDDYTDFSWSRCDACGSNLGGARYGAIAVTR